MIRVLLVEDHSALREALAIVLEQHPGMVVVGQASSVREAGELLKTDLQADVAVIDLNLPDGDGTDVIRLFHEVCPDGSVLVLTALAETKDRARAVAAGALGVLHKSAAPDEIASAVRRLHNGESLFTPNQIIELVRLAGDQLDRDRRAREMLERLTPRELEVVRILAEGLSDKAVADRLFISSKTVRIHVANILEKLQLESRLQLVLFAANHGLVEIRWPTPRSSPEPHPMNRPAADAPYPNGPAARRAEKRRRDTRSDLPDMGNPTAACAASRQGTAGADAP